MDSIQGELGYYTRGIGTLYKGNRDTIQGGIGTVCKGNRDSIQEE